MAGGVILSVYGEATAGSMSGFFTTIAVARAKTSSSTEIRTRPLPPISNGTTATSACGIGETLSRTLQ